MKNVIRGGLCLVALGVSTLSFGFTAAGQDSLAGADESRALQLTRGMVYADLEQNMRCAALPLVGGECSGFGIDDTKSYSQQPQAGSFTLAVKD